VGAEDGGLVDEGFGSPVFPAEGVGTDDAGAVVVGGLHGSAVGDGLVEHVPGGGESTVVNRRVTVTLLPDDEVLATLGIRFFRWEAR
jgi:hypothetical protein